MKLHVLIALAVFAQGCSKDEPARKKRDKPKVEQPKGGDGLIKFSAKLTTNPVDPDFKPSEKDSWNIQQAACGVRNKFYEEKCKTDLSYFKAGAGKKAEGSVIATYDSKTRTLDFTVDYHGLSGPPLMMHFHLNKNKGGLNPIVQTVCGLPHGSKGGAIGHSAGKPTSGDVCPKGTKDPKGVFGHVKGAYTLGGNDDLKPQGGKISVDREIHDLKSGNLYLNIHTCLHPLGELSGFLKKQ